jgi:CRP/FNR family transcriptional regulator
VAVDVADAICALAGEDAGARELLHRCPRLKYAAGETVLPEALRDVALLAVEQGLIAVRADIPDSMRGVIVCHAGPGALILPPKQNETLQVVEAARLAALDADARDQLLAIPGAAVAVFSALEETLRQKTETIVALSSFHHAERVRKKLVQLARDYGRVGREGVRLDLPLTHDLLSEMTGSARETVTRALDDLQREGFVKRIGREYVLDAAVTDLTSASPG